MSKYIALIEQDSEGYGASFPDCPGCVAQSASLDETLVFAAEALAEWMADRKGDGVALVPPTSLSDVAAQADVRAAIDGGALLVAVPLLLDEGRAVKANLSLDAGLLAAIDKAAEERGITRSAYLASAARQKIAMEG